MTSVIVKGKYRTVSVSNIDIDSGIDSPSPATLFFCRKMSEKWKNTGQRNCSNLHNNLLTIEKKFHFQTLLHFVSTIKTSHYFHKLLPFSTVMMFTTKKKVSIANMSSFVGTTPATDQLLLAFSTFSPSFINTLVFIPERREMQS